MGKSSVDVDEFVDLTESPMKIPAHSDTEVGSVSQSECYIGINPNTSKPEGIAFNA